MSILITIIAAFVSGVFATALGALGAVILCALVSVIGLFCNAAGCDYNIIANIGFGMFLGPQVAFGPALCAMNYAWKKGYIEDSKGIALPLASTGKVDVLLVGGVFAVIGWYMNTAFSTFIPGKFDTVAATIVIINMIAKVMFGNEGLMGKVPEGDRRFGVGTKTKWLPFSNFEMGSAFWLFGAAVGAISGYVYFNLEEYAASANLPLLGSMAFVITWGLGVVFLILMCCGLPCPVHHHTGLVACYGAQMAYGLGCSMLEVIIWGVAFGVFAHYMGDLTADLFLNYGEGYVDPPSAAMLVCSPFAFFIFPALGIVKAGSAINIIVPVVISIAFLAYAIYTDSKMKAAK